MIDFEVCSVSLSTARGRLPTEASCGPAGSVHRLGNVHAVDIVLEMVIEEANQYGSTKVKLKQVPQFLVNAFNFINSHGMNVEGLFRREGNASRLNRNNWAVYLGAAPIPASFTVHDVCSMVKRFFRDLKEPLLSCALLRKKLLDLARKMGTTPITRREFCAIFEPGFEADKKDLDCSIPPAHIGTLGYLMRQLHRISRHSDKHQMHAINLATVFAPNLFRGDAGKEKGKRKERRGSQDDILVSIRGDTELQISAVRLLIEYSNWIGLHPNCYVTSIHHHRSSSATPCPRPPVVLNMNNLKEKSLDRKNSVKGDQSGRTKCSNARRSSSAFRGIIHGISDRLLKRSPSRDRVPKNPFTPKAERRTSSPAIFVSNEPFSIRQNNRQSRKASPRHMLEFADSPTQDGSSEYPEAHLRNSICHDTLRTSSTRIAHSRQLHCSSTVRQAMPSIQPVGRFFRQGCATSVARRNSIKKRCDSSPLRTNKVLKDNPVSMLGEEYFNPSYREQHERSRRRHTAPVKTTTTLRRNQPNTRHSGLVLPKRKTTVVNANDQEKENCDYHPTDSASINNSYVGFDGKVLEDKNSALIGSSADLLAQKGQESRMRRVKRQQRKEISSMFQDSLLDSTISRDYPIKNESGRELVSAACSPILFPAEEKVPASHGSAIVGKTIVVDTAPTQSEQAAIVGETIVIDTASAQVEQANLHDAFGNTMSSAVTHSSDSAPHTHEGTSLCSSPKTAKTYSKIGSPSISTNQNEDDPKNSAVDGSNDEKAVVFRVPSLRIPTHASANVVVKSVVQTRFNIEKRSISPTHPSSSKSLPVIPKMMSLSSSLSNNVDGEVFFTSSEMKTAILSSSCEEDMEDSFAPLAGSRPSVIMIEQQGIVRNRVNMFRQMGHSMPAQSKNISERRSGLVSHSSIDAGSSQGDEEFVKPSAPPVTHSLCMGGSRRSFDISASQMPTGSLSSPK